MWPKTPPTPCCVGLFDIWPDAYGFLEHLIPKPGSGYSLATIVGAVLAALLTFTVISAVMLMILKINPPACTCPEFDYGLVSWRAFPNESIIFSPTLNVWAQFGRGPAAQPPINYSATSNSSKFGIISGPVGVSPPGWIQYTPVFIGPNVRIVGTVSASFTYYSQDPTDQYVSIQTAAAWSRDGGTTWTNITEGLLKIGSVQPGSGEITLPYSITFTPAQMNAGSVLITMLRFLIPGPSGANVRFYPTSLSIQATEM